MNECVYVSICNAYGYRQFLTHRLLYSHYVDRQVDRCRYRYKHLKISNEQLKVDSYESAVLSVLVKDKIFASFSL